MDKIIYGGDTETLDGEPLSLQFYSEDIACEDIYFVTARTARDTFLRWCKRRRRGCQHVVYVHNLAFDLVEFLWGRHSEFVTRDGSFDFRCGDFRVTGCYGTPTYARLSDSAGRSIYLCDSFSYFRGSLEKGAELFCPDLPKLSRPDGLGSKRFCASDTDFCEYAMRDAEVSYHMGRAIERMHVTYDLQQCISVADMAAKVFRHRFLTYTIPQPPRDVIDGALCSYHGGKNNLNAESGWHDDIYSVDISSAYPHAMHGLPAFSDARLYRAFRGRASSAVPDLGVYCVRGKLSPCAYPVLFSHSFKPLSGEMTDVWVQGYELNEALRSGEFKPSRIRGTYYAAEKDHQAPALRQFVETFYKLKESETDPVLRYMQKLILNSVSGKFIQTRKAGSQLYTDIDADVTTTAAELTAGGMFHPFIASAITAHTRARIHRIEHRYEALHTATDGVFIKGKPSARGFDLGISSAGGLGALTLEAEDAQLLLIRNKCYVLYTAEGKKTTPSRVFEGKHIRKHALHGFQAGVTELEKMVASGRRKYSVTRPWRLRQALKLGHTPNRFEERSYTLKVGPLTLHDTPQRRVRRNHQRVAARKR